MRKWPESGRLIGRLIVFLYCSPAGNRNVIEAFEEYFATTEIKFDSQQAVFSGFCKFKENGSRSVAASMQRKPLMIKAPLSLSLSKAMQ